MKIRILALSLAAASASSLAVILDAAAPAPSTGASVEITAPADRSRAQWGSQLPYSVIVSYGGKSSRFGEIPSNQVVVRAAYVPDAGAPARTAELPEALVQISRSNCTGCHDFAASAAGPSFAAIAKRYAGRGGAAAALADHIRNGTHGGWGSGSMPPHPDMIPAQASAIAQWIVSQGNDPSVRYSVGKTGSVRMNAPVKPAPHAGIALSAYYAGPLKPGESRNSASGRHTIMVLGSGS